MNKLFLYLILFVFSCDTGNLKVITDLPKTLNEVSGTETVDHSDLIWMLNDGGNPNKIYGVNTDGKIKKEILIKAKNNDWEDLTTDEFGNLFIGDFGNNQNHRKDLSILKIKSEDLIDSKNAEIERIYFHFPDQKKFPPKKKKMHFDCEAFFHFNDSLYLFTKSRENHNVGKTNLYKIPAVKGNHEAQFISSFKTCDELPCWITSADINSNGKQVALLTLDAVWLFSDYTKDNFFNGKAIQISFEHESQKEGICFKNDSTLYITDERSHGNGRNLYEFKIE